MVLGAVCCVFLRPPAPLCWIGFSALCVECAGDSCFGRVLPRVCWGCGGEWLRCFWEGAASCLLGGCGVWLLSAGMHWALIHPEGKEKRSAALFAAALHVLLGSLSNEKAGLQVQLLLHVFCMHE